MANGFTYCWSDHATSKVYIGVHKGHFNDKYICSSKFMLKEYKQRPNDFTRKILFSGLYEDCANFEVALIKGLFKTNPDTFYNRSVGKKILFDEQIKKKISNALMGNKNGLGAVGPWKGKQSPQKGTKCSDESKKKISEAKKGMISPNKGKIASAETRKKMSDSAKKKTPISDEHKAKLSLAAKADWAKRKQEKYFG
jgi:hypothetical protein